MWSGGDWPYLNTNTVDSVPFPRDEVKFVRQAIGGAGVDLSLALLDGCDCQSTAQCCQDSCDSNRECKVERLSLDVDTGSAPNDNSVPRSHCLPTEDDGQMAEASSSGGERSTKSCPCTARYDTVCGGDGKLKHPEWSDRPLLECGVNCTCPETCGNRFVQRNSHGAFPMEIYRHCSRGWSVRALCDIPSQSFVCEYSGRIVREEEARRYDEQRADKPNYLLVLKEHNSNGTVLKTFVNAAACGNVSRFFNHSCNPNLELLAVRTGSIIPRLVFFAKRAIKPGEDMVFSYGVANGVSSAETSSRPRIQCLCESSNCCGYLPFDETAFTAPPAVRRTDHLAE